MDSDAIVLAVNVFRSVDQVCGGTPYPAAPPLTWNTQLEDAAKGHSIYMAEIGIMQHAGPGNNNVGDRVTAKGYVWTAVAENVARGQADETSALTGWEGSAGHCANLMNPNYTQMGLAGAVAAGGTNYWTQVFARPAN